MTQTLRRSDEQLKTAVIQELQWISSVDSEHIRVRVDEGAVTLSGTVSTYPETLLAAKAALTVRGVTAIAQELNVAGPFAEGSDTDIARQAGHALENAVNIPATVKVSVRNHVITLSGEVTWQYQRDAACRAVNYIPGVRIVENSVTIRTGVLAAGVKADIIAALVRNAQFDGRNITVSTDTRGVITLDGTIRSPAEGRAAAKVCWSASGVTEVVNNLRVEA
jgi:osmotically-inducible protein OsmY